MFFTLLQKTLPLYLLIAAGWALARARGARKETVATLLLYGIAPAVFFDGVARMDLRPGMLLLPVAVYALSCATCLLFYAWGGLVWPARAGGRDATRYVLAFTAGTANNGYFGLPLTLILLGEGAVGTLVLVIVGVALYENTLGFYLTARGHHTAREALGRVARLPTVYAFAAAVLLNIAEQTGAWQPEGAWVAALGDLAQHLRGAYSVLGMMLIGMGMAASGEPRAQERHAAPRRWLRHFDARLVGLAFLARFGVWPLGAAAIIALDAGVLGGALGGPPTHAVLRVVSIVPLAANTVAVATELRAEPEKAATAVFVSTLFALVYVPWAAGWVF